MRPLEGLLVLDFSIFLSGPSAAQRLADLGARVINVERPDGGDLCRQLYISELELDGESTLFHSINRNKESFAANLKDPADLARVHELIARADVLVQNFRPGVMTRLGLDYETVRAINPRIVYGEITGYGNEGVWVYKPGQDLLLQAISGLVWLNGDADRPPRPLAWQWLICSLARIWCRGFWLVSFGVVSRAKAVWRKSASWNRFSIFSSRC